MKPNRFRRLLAGSGLCLLLTAGSAVADPIQVGVHQAEFNAGNQPTLLGQTGAAAVRTDLNWSDVQPCASGRKCADSPFDFSSFDARFEALSKAGVGPEFLTLISAPRWAAAHCKSNAQCTPAKAKLPEWKAYVRAVLKRYGPQGSFWKSIDAPKSHRIQNFVLWNEANHDKNWNGDASYKGYRRLLARTREVFEKTAPSANLDAGNVAYGGRSTKPPSWLRLLINRTNAERDFKILTIHPYSRTPQDVVAKARATQDLHGVNRIAITEIGWGIDHGGGSGRTNAKCVRSQSEQAGRLTNTFRMLAKRVPQLQWVFWFNGIDNDTGGGCNNSPNGKTFGLYEDGSGSNDFAAKDSLAAFKRLAPRLR